MDLLIDPHRTADLLAQLVRIDSVNPSLVPGGRGEGQIARLIADLASASGLEVHMREAAPGRPNVIARLPGRGGGKALIWNAHLDTVSAEGVIDPFTPRLEDGRLYGRGAIDDKASLAAGMIALLALKEGGGGPGRRCDHGWCGR